eukprot:149590-Prymnesium_polylepis.1
MVLTEDQLRVRARAPLTCRVEQYGRLCASLTCAMCCSLILPQEFRMDALAEDIDIDIEKMRGWSEEQACASCHEGPCAWRIAPTPLLALATAAATAAAGNRVFRVRRAGRARPEIAHLRRLLCRR